MSPQPRKYLVLVYDNRPLGGRDYEMEIEAYDCEDAMKMVQISYPHKTREGSSEVRPVSVRVKPVEVERPVGSSPILGAEYTGEICDDVDHYKNFVGVINKAVDGKQSIADKPAKKSDSYPIDYPTYADPAWLNELARHAGVPRQDGVSEPQKNESANELRNKDMASNLDDLRSRLMLNLVNADRTRYHLEPVVDFDDVSAQDLHINGSRVDAILTVLAAEPMSAAVNEAVWTEWLRRRVLVEQGAVDIKEYSTLVGLATLAWRTMLNQWGAS
jgi:hypothetical protein